MLLVAIVPIMPSCRAMPTEPAAPIQPDPASGGLVARLVEVSELHGDFELSSGKRSAVYFDKFLFLTRPDLLRELANEVARLVPDRVDHLAAPEGAATLLVAAVSLETGLPVAVVRKEPKAYGTRSQVEGHAPRGARVCLIEDVSTTGHQVRRAAAALTDTGATIERIVLAIDRGGADHLREAGYDVAAVAVLRPEEPAS
jgi:orotate phosphoribosyltransferase